MPTLAEKLLQQGREEGREEGRLSMALRAFTRKFGSLDPVLVTRLEQLSTAELEQLSDDLLDLTSESGLREWLARLEKV